MSSGETHSKVKILSRGPAPERAGATLVLLHGRGATAESILSLTDEIGVEGVAAVAPEAANQSWYPHSFLSRLEMNQPYLDDALAIVERIVNDLVSRGIASERIVLAGFSQGACLVSEIAARHPRKYGAIIALTGGLIGPPGTPRNYAGSLSGARVFLGAGDPDPHVPFWRVEETGSVFRQMGAQVDVRRYPGLPHSVNQEEIDVCRELIQGIVALKPPEESTHG